MKNLVIASHNEGKVSEIRHLLAPLGFSVISARELDLPEPEETGSSFVENATLKAEQAAMLSGEFSLADDSGLCVEALDGAPGIYSARWAGEKKDFNAATARITEELRHKGLEIEGARAYFICVLALSSPHEKVKIFEGEVHGYLTFPARGKHGFGYDPIFIPDGYEMTFGEMEPSAKHAISHRFIAFQKFVDYLKKNKLNENI